MKVKLLEATDNPIEVMWVAARTCYSEKSPIEIWEWKYGEEPVTDETYGLVVKEHQEKMWKLVKSVISSGHDSIAQHISFTFAVEGISRACSHQLVRHRHAVFSQKSQRYVEIEEDQDHLEELFTNTDYHNDYEHSELHDIFEKYFTENTFKNVNGYYFALDNYLEAIKDGEKPEDARRFLPNAIKTDLVMSMNLGELIHVSHLRLCTRAQSEIRHLFQAIKNEVKKYNPQVASLLVPSCEVNGFCKEHKCCGRKPTLNDVMSKYKGEYEDGT